jgi:hypothetical protein
MLYNFVMGKEEEVDARLAEADVQSTVHMLIYSAFWNERKGYFHCIDENELVSATTRTPVTPTHLPIPNDNSDTDSDSLVSKESDDEDSF